MKIPVLCFRVRSFHTYCVFAAWFGMLMSASAAPPELTDVDLRGLTVGQATRVTLHGQNFEDEVKIVVAEQFVPHQIFEQTATQITADISLPSGVLPDLVPLRILTQQGLSNALVTAVDHLPQQNVSSEATLPVAMTGRLQGNQSQVISFSAEQGDIVVIDVEANRLGGSLRPTLSVFDPADRIIATARPERRLLGDCRCRFTCPQTGAYRIELRDLVFQAPANGFYRIKIGDLVVADFTRPIAVATGKQQSVLFGSSLQAEADAPWAANVLAAPSLFRWLPVRVPAEMENRFTGPAVRAMVGSDIEINWNDLADQALDARNGISVGVSGELTRSASTATIAFSVTPGQTLTAQVFADRLGEPLDSLLHIATADGKKLADGDDAGGSLDPSVTFTVPDDCQQIVATVTARAFSGSPAATFRLAIARDAGKLQAKLLTDRMVIPSSSRTVVPIELAENSSDTILSLASGSEWGLCLDQAVIPANRKRHLISLVAPHDTSLVSAIALAVAPQQADAVAQAVHTPALPGWLGRYADHQLTTAIVSAVPLDVVWEAVPDRLVHGMTESILVQIPTPLTDSVAKLQWQLVTNQVPPTKKEGNQDVLDLPNTLRIDSVTSPLTQASVEFSLRVPATLPADEWQLALQATVVEADQGPALENGMVVYSVIHNIRSYSPLQIRFDTTENLTAISGTGEAGSLTGKIERLADLPELPVLLELAGLPEGFASPRVSLPANESNFVLPLKFEAGKPSQDLKNIRLIASYAGDVTSCQDIRVESEPFEIKLVAEEKE
ncbi:MAG: hypothetical protein R3C28_25125 [Pirellulaceae bacterium]